MSTFYLVAFSLITVLNVCCCLKLLCHRGPLGMGRIAAVAAVLLGLNIAEMLVLLPFGLNWFGRAQLAWLDLAVVVPCCSVAALVGRWRGRSLSGPATVIALLGLLMIPIAAQAWFVTPFDLELVRQRVPLAARRSGEQPLRIAVLADIQATQIGEYEIRAVERIMTQSPDVILLPGDLYQGPVEEFDEHRPAFHGLLQRLHAPGGVWAVSGNAEYKAGIPALLRGTDVRLLEDEVVRFSVGDRKLALIGLSDRATIYRRGRPSAPAVLQRFAEEPAGDEIRLLLCHRPGWVLTLPEDSSIDLTVAGHTHGGQVSLPLIGPPLVLSRLPRQVCAGGLSLVNGQQLYVSRGLGLERAQAPRIRFGVRPEVTLLTLVTAEQTLP